MIDTDAQTGTDTGTLRLSRAIKAAPDTVYTALIDPAARSAWGPPGDGHVVRIEGQPAPSPGIREVSRCGPADNPYVTVLTDWVLMEPATRLVYAETLMAEGAALGSSLACCDLTASDIGTNLTVTVQIMSFIGDEMLSEFEGGWTHAFENLARYAETQAA
ncbi:SRPBCC domain-containing protein [Primorskyibacter aestuariivivens]|uniref:SRPBCC family protein n=1 Tax=Primorskyibacter aestuariivivens TaxID=1888912 RepID=UPI002300DEC9|nr:SRPBCC domain-containing protein [Primorskyibacter aestuariivivens]MDA7428565.1 SRPBCC domain-containing protein [Primorskyibacter aestuariivivens]